MIKKTIVQYITLTSLYCFAIGLIAAMYVTFLTSHGLNLFEVNMVNFTFFATLFICEIPTGAFADLFGRKMSFVIACIMLSIGGFIYAFSKSFWGFVGAEAISAIGATFASGAFKAWLVDKLKHHGYSKSLSRVFSKAQLFGQLSSIVSALIGAYIADINIVLPWIFLAVLMLITGLVALFWLKEEYFIRQRFSIKLGAQAMKNTVKQSIEFGINNKAVRFLLVIGLIQIFAVQAPNMQWQPYFIQYLIEKKLLGYLWVGMMLGILVGSLIANKFLALIKDEKKALTICQLATGIGIAIITLLPFQLGIFVFIMHEIPRGMYTPLKDKFLQDNIPSHARATISSFEAVAPHLGGMIGLFASGIIANKFGISTAWVTSGLLMVILTLAVMKNGKQKNLA